MFALLGLYVLGLASLKGIALAVALTVLLTMVASLTLLPALLGLFGKRLERSIHKRSAKRPDGMRWERWSAFVQRRPLPALVIALPVLLALCLPVTGMHLGFADAGNDAKSTTARQAYDLLAKGFGPGFNGPLLVVSEGGDPAALERVIADTPGVAQVAPAEVEGDVATLLVFPASAPQDKRTDALIKHLRDDVLPGQRGTNLVGGSTAAELDSTAEINQGMPIFLLVVVGLSAVLLAVVFRSVFIPLKAAVLNLLTIGASLGVVTLVFNGSGPIDAFVPVMIFAIVFGLSMDYEVFLMSRMHEEYERGKDAGRAISVGLATTGRVITAAGAIMIVVFGAFIVSPDPLLQQFGLGLGVAILLDAFLIRCLIVPAAMQLAGERAWWMPTWLARRLPRVALEG
jgi:RND superfamily putative drug exporter